MVRLVLPLNRQDDLNYFYSTNELNLIAMIMNNESYENQKNQLMNSWRKLKKEGDIGFVTDGIINFDKWITYDLKLLFLAREAYSDSDIKWDYAEWYNDGNGRVIYPKGQGFHNRINEWSYAVDSAMHGKQSASFEEASNYEQSKKITLASAIINLKKIGGSSKSVPNDLRSIALRDKELLLKQLELISPNIILFCATFGDVLKNILFERAIKIPETERCYESEGILLIDFFHPTRAYKGSFDFLFDDVSKIKNKAKYLK